MSFAAQTIRPFKGLETMADLFADSSLFFGLDRCSANDSIVLPVDPEEYGRRPVVLQWAPLDAFTSFLSRLSDVPDALGIPIDALSLVATASTSYLKRTDVVLNIEIGDRESLVPDQPLTNGRRADAFNAGHHGCSVDVYLALNRDLEPSQLRPWRKTTWLSRCKFGLHTARSQSVFRPTPLSNDLKSELGLADKTVRFLQFGDHDVLLPYAEQADSPRFYIDELLMAELSANSNSGASRLMQLQLVLDFIGDVIHAASLRRDDLLGTTWEDIETSLLGRVIRIVAGPGSQVDARSDLLSLVRSDPARVLAFAEHRVNLPNAVSRALREVSP